MFALLKLKFGSHFLGFAVVPSPPLSLVSLLSFAPTQTVFGCWMQFCNRHVCQLHISQRHSLHFSLAKLPLRGSLAGPGRRFKGRKITCSGGGRALSPSRSPPPRPKCSKLLLPLLQPTPGRPQPQQTQWQRRVRLLGPQLLWHCSLCPRISQQPAGANHPSPPPPSSTSPRPRAMGGGGGGSRTRRRGEGRGVQGTTSVTL